MCSLHVLPTIGSNITVHVTSVNLHSHSDFVEFGGNFKHGQLTREIYQLMKKEVHLHKDRVCNFEGNPGDLCLIEEENNWHRARILSRCEEKYNVFLIDDGRTLWVSNSILAQGQRSLFNLPPMMELFVLASVSPLPPENKWSPTASKFLKSLTGKTVSGCVQDVMMPSRIILLDIPSVFKQIHELGFAKKIPCEKFQILVEDFLHSPRDGVSWPGSSVTNAQPEHTSSINNFQQYLCPELLPGSIETVEVTQVVNPLKIFCRLHVFSYELKTLSKQIQEYYESTTSALMPKPLSVGCPCATKGSDGMWYRSVLQQSIVSDIAKVFHVDYGMEDFVQLDHIRQLSEKFFRLPVLTYACSLYGIMDKGSGWTTCQIDHLKSVLLNQIFFGKFEHQSLSDGIYHVTLYGNDGVNINNSFAVQEKCFFMPERESCCSLTKDKGTHKVSAPAWTQLSALETSPADMTSAYRRLHNGLPDNCKRHSVLDEHLFTVGSVVEVKVSYVENDQTFWCQMADSLSSLNMLMEEIQKHYSCSQFQKPTGSVCVVRHPDNGMWYRAQVLNPQLTSQVDVHLIDYGEQLNVPLQDLRPIDPKFLKLKRQSFQCSLFSKLTCVSCENSALSDSAFSDSLDYISSASLQNVSLKCTIRGVMNHSQHTMLNIVDIETQHPVLCSMHVKKEVEAVEALKIPSVLNDTHVDPTHNIKVGAEETVWITCVKGVDHFYGQFKRNADTVEKLTKGIQQLCGMTQHTRNQWSPQMMCLARYKDGQWYRGLIKTINPQVTVHFVDYGDLLALDASDIVPFPASHSADMFVPFQAVQFSLSTITPGESTAELNNWFESYATDHIFTATIMGTGPTGELLVELHDGKIHINVKVKEKLNEIQSKEHNAKKIPPKKRDNFDSRFGAVQDYVNAPKAMDERRFTGQIFEKVQCTDFDISASEHFRSQEMEKPMDPAKPMLSPCSKLKDLPSRSMKSGFISEVYVSHSNSPSSFFVQLACEDPEICSLADKLNCSQCESQVQFNQFLPGDLVKAEYPSDGAWYRAVIKNKLDVYTVQVEFIDYGNEANVPVSKMRHLDSQFLKFPRYSIHCCLNVGDADRQREWAEQMDIFKTGERKLLCNFIEANESVWQVILQEQNLILAESSLEMESSLESKSCNPPLSVSSGNASPGAYKKPNVSLDQRIEAYASSVVGPNYFWCQFADSEKLDSTSAIAQEMGNSSQTTLIQLDHLSQGDPCLALFPDDNLWYRAQVISTSASSVSVLFVDFGNESEIKQASVSAIPTSLLETPPQAFLCRLEGFKATDGLWNDAASGRFTELMVDKLLNVIIQNVEMASDLPNCPQYNVRVECSTVCINDLMKDFWNECTAEVCRLTEDVFLKPVTATDVAVNKCGAHNTLGTQMASNPSVKCFPKVTDLPPTAIERDLVSEVYVSHINSPFSFFVQLTEDENCLISLTEELNAISSSVNDQVKVHSFAHGDLVKAVFLDDNSWYRAVVKEIKGKDVHVEFIDFGNEETVPASNVCKLDEQFLQFPRFSIHCCLKTEDNMGIPMGKEKGTCPLANVLGKVGEKRFCTFFQEDKSVWEVRIADQRCTLNDPPLEIWDDFSTLSSDFPKQDLSFKKAEISVGQTLDAYASSIIGPSYFWCQRANSEELNKISLIAQETGNSAETACVQIDHVSTGDLCLALFTDKLWYRAQVIGQSPNSISVLFVDFGNKSEIDANSVKPLPLGLRESPLQAFLCHLEGFSLSDGSWNNCATDEFCDLILDKPLKLTVANIQNYLDSPSPSYCVKVHSEECVVNEKMKNFWSASVYQNDESHNSPFSNTNALPLLCNARSAPESRALVMDDNCQENIRTSDTCLHSTILFEKQDDPEFLWQNDELKVKEKPLTATDLNSVSPESSLALKKNVSENEDKIGGVDINGQYKSSQNCHLVGHLPLVGTSETASSNGSDQSLITQGKFNLPNGLADSGSKAGLDGIFLKRDT